MPLNGIFCPRPPDNPLSFEQNLYQSLKQSAGLLLDFEPPEDSDPTEDTFLDLDTFGKSTTGKEKEEEGLTDRKKQILQNTEGIKECAETMKTLNYTASEEIEELLRCKELLAEDVRLQ
eukprot:CAMPEP_0174279500 /NCGR_PEP_ID=MMETSP0439-20130205/62074_1 /TAXON_ID=0 /ORGANISM="Stereomyxa ramosa, Strain Chinc5" /LENGTH=118 /DNA_ID=CAMNT_0015372037 /DNA_START=567 /DNA_END=920 /DNA_ORIENTATION=+